MKHIKILDELNEKQVNICETDVNSIFYKAYLEALELQNETINIVGFLNKKNIEEIIQHCKFFNVNSITISDGTSNLVEVLANFERLGCKLVGLTKIKTWYLASDSNEQDFRHALKVKIK